MQKTYSSSSRHPRADRTTTSCTECRRRKQKCNQEHPCNNCSRRFPQPRCEYIHKNPNGRQQTQGLPNMSVFSAETGQRQSHTLTSLSIPGAPEALIPGPSALGILDPDPDPDPDPGPSTFQYRDHAGRSEAPSIGPRQETDSEPVRSDTYHHDTVATKGKGVDPAPHPGELWAHPNPHLAAESLANASSPPIKPTKLNKLLMKTFVDNLAKFKGPLEGQPEPGNPFVDVYAPWCFQSPLLAPVALSVAATSLLQLRQIDQATAMGLREEATQTLNRYLCSSQSASDETISAVSQLVLNDWYFGDTRGTQAEIRTIRELVRLRGGFAQLGVQGLVSKTALVTDCFIAISLETVPLHQHGFLDTGPEFDLHEPLPMELNPNYNNPFAPHFLYPPLAMGNSLGLHAATIRMLDDIRLLFAAILSLAPAPSPEELERVQQTARQILDRTSDLHDINPDAPPRSSLLDRSSRTPSSTHSSPSTPSSSHSIASSAATQAKFISQSHDPRHLVLRTAPQPDFIYATVRETAILYSRAAAARLPLSTVCPIPHFYALWAMMWRVPLRRWHSLLGIFLWVVVALVPAAAQTPFASLAKSLLHIGSVQIGLDHWQVCIGMLRSAVRVVAWLAGGDRPQEDPGSPIDTGQ